MSLAPRPLTMDRLGEKEELILAQSTSQCCRCCCFQPSINWVLAEGDNFTPGTNPFSLDSVGWIHEESSFCQRTWSWLLPGCRAIKYVQHAGPAPASIMKENEGWFTCQTGDVSDGLAEKDIESNIVATHEKALTCGYCFQFGDLTFPICNCVPLPYLETKNMSGEVIGRTVYVCDHCCFVPKYDVIDASGQTKHRIRPDTCVGGLCIQCRCDGPKGKCFRVPFIIRDPDTKEPRMTAGNETKAQVDVLWSGWANECCTQKNAYHVAFPQGMTEDDKLLLLGSAVLVDVTMFEQQDDN